MPQKRLATVSCHVATIRHDAGMPCLSLCKHSYLMPAGMLIRGHLLHNKLKQNSAKTPQNLTKLHKNSHQSPIKASVQVGQG